MELLVCVGSACHLRGANQVLRECTDAIERFGLGGLVELKAGFCQGRCTEGVNFLLDGERIGGVLPGKVLELFTARIIPRLKEVARDGSDRPNGRPV